MSKTESSFSRIITRRDFLCGSATVLAGVPALESLPASGQQKVSARTDYSSVIEKIRQALPVAMVLKDITGASVAFVDGENIVWSGGFGFG